MFTHWAHSAQVDEDRFYEFWKIDDAYRAHEKGLLSFEDYTEHLGQLFDISISMQAWTDGWNDIWTEPFHDVLSLLPSVAQRYPLYCFTNTNDTHALHWRHHYPRAISHFEQIYVSSELGQRKPDTVAFQTVCQDIGVATSEVLFLDDTLENVEGASTAGLQAKHVKKPDSRHGAAQ